MTRKLFLTILLALVATPLGAAEIRWIGRAQDVPQIDVLDFDGTWAATNTASLTCNSKTITVTGGASLDTPAEYAAAFVEMVNSTDHDTDNIEADATFNSGGYEFGEFRDMVASLDPADATKVLLTSAKPGVPFDVTVAETASGSITLTSDGTGGSQLATGKHWWDNTANWDGADVPDADDSALLDQGSTDIKYALANSTVDVSLTKKNGFIGNVGLPLVNTTHTGFHYKEYRATRLTLPITATSGLQTHVIGERNSALPATGFVYLDFGSNDGSLQELIVFDAPQHNAQTGAAVQFYGGNDLDLYVHRGSVSCGDGLSTQASGIGILHVNYVGNKTSDARVFMGIYATMESGGPIVQTGGTLIMEGSPSSTSTIDLSAGNFYFPGTCGTLNVRGGAAFYRNDSSNTTTNLFVFGGGTIDATQTEAITITNATVYKNAIWKDPLARLTLTNGIDFVGCSWATITDETKESQTWTPSAL
jgi:hypothetical protein